MQHSIRDLSQSPVNLWPYRLWVAQARRLYPTSPQRQQRMVLEHIQIAQACTMSPERWRGLAEIGAHLAEKSEGAL